MDGWYHVTVYDIRRHGGSALLRDYYGDSPYQALKLIYDEHQWLPWKFKSPPKGLWSRKENHQQFFDWIRGQLDIKNMDDWYNVTMKQIFKQGGQSLIRT